MLKFFLISLITFSFIFSGCDNTHSFDRSALKDEKQKRKLKKVNEADILSEATLAGQNIAQEAERLLVNRSENSKLDHSNEPLNHAKVNWIHETDSLQALFEAEINYLSLITSGKSKAISKTETELWEAYQYDLENNGSLTENIQKAETGYLLFSAPVYLNSRSCLNCHGKDADVEPRTLEILRELYPNSKINGYDLGQPLGFRTIRLSQKKIIQDL